MTRDAFRRLALMVASSVWLAAIAAAWLWLDWIVAVAAIFGGTVVAATLTVEPTPTRGIPEAGLQADLARQGEGHREIARRRRLSLSDDDVA